MTSYLLLGAGISRNWGGWPASEAFEYLLGRQEIAGNEPLRRLLWKPPKALGHFTPLLLVGKTPLLRQSTSRETLKHKV